MSNKSYFIVAILDENGAEAILNLQKELGIELDNLNDIPHLTLASYEETIDADNLLEWVNEFSQKQKSVDLCLYALTVIHINGLIALPLISPELYELYYNIHQKYDKYSRFGNLTSGWFPHITIAYTNNNKIINEKILRVTNRYNFINTKIISLWVSCLDDDRVLTILGKFPLQD
ncbi:MAG: hypothetical protein FWF92_06040 [Oscillospiraceae bacterium]|nr:hypothetical protein [Oscillospiraceae bacterium]